MYSPRFLQDLVYLVDDHLQGLATDSDASCQLSPAQSCHTTLTAMTGIPLNTVSVVSMLATALMGIVSYILTQFVGKRVSKTDRWVLMWLWWDAMIHFFVEGPFIYFSLIGTVKDSDHVLALLWKEYGKADSRWLVSDPTVVSLEVLTVLFDGPMCLLLIYAICRNKHYRHWVQIVLCVCELYGGWMTFCPEWLIGSPALDTGNPLYLWCYLVFFNGLWVVIPLALMYQSWAAMRSAFGSKISHSHSKKSR